MTKEKSQRSTFTFDLPAKVAYIDILKHISKTTQNTRPIELKFNNNNNNNNNNDNVFGWEKENLCK